MAPIVFVDNLLVYFTLVSNIIILYIFVEIIGYQFRKKYIFENVMKIFKGESLVFMFIISLIATLGSLYYSEIAGYAPCLLCWYQRIFMYPQIFILGLAIYRKDRKIIPYSLILSFVGFFIALYHYRMQISQIDSVLCNLVGYSASCSESFFMSFGYITIPFMALSAFLLMILIGIKKI